MDTPCIYVRAATTHLDLFQFTVVVSEFRVGVEVEICLCFRTVSGEEFWDNNYGRNYKVMVVESSAVSQQYVSLTRLKEKRSTNISPYW